MDDYSLSSLAESKNEWCSRLVNTLTPAIKQGIRSIFEEAWKLCQENHEQDKYLMTFQTFLSRVPKWNDTIISTERKHIVEVTGCKYLEDLITCVHVVQLKALTCVRVGQKAKKVDIDVPSVDTFLHKVYINVARKIYMAVYLFETHLDPLVAQQRNAVLEALIHECILNTVRESVPVEHILRAYMGETYEQDVEVKEVVEDVPPPPPPSSSSSSSSSPASAIPSSSPASAVPSSEADDPSSLSLPDDKPVSISFSDMDKHMTVSGVEEEVLAPKTEERLEALSDQAYERRKQEEEEDDGDKLMIGSEVTLELNEIDDLTPKVMHLNTQPLLDIQVLS
jgi:hypothetical protein